MLKSALVSVMLVAAAPAFAQEGPRIDLAALKTLAAQASKLFERQPADAALAIAQFNLCDEVAQAARQERGRAATRLKVAPR